MPRGEEGGPPAAVLSWAHGLTGRVAAVSGNLAGAYLHGSAALGGWVPGRSDVDVLFVAGGELPPARLVPAAEALVAASADCPGTALECSVVTAGQARRPAAPWPFVLHVHAGPGAGQPRVVRGADSPGDRDLLMHYAVCRAAGRALRGPPPGEVFGRVPRPEILSYLADELAWGLASAPEPYAVLNACRALVFAAVGKIVSKTEGGAIALERGLGPPAVIRRALGQQRGLLPVQPPAPDATAFVEHARQLIRIEAQRT